jgi:hypothetical protein
MTAPSDDRPQPSAGHGQAVDADDELGFDASLVPFAPTRLLPVVSTALVLIAVGAVTLVLAPLYVRFHLIHLSAVIPGLACLVIALGILLGITGYRAYATFAEPEVSRHMRVQLGGFWILLMGVLVAGIVGPSVSMALYAFGLSQGVWFVHQRRARRPADTVPRFVLRMRPAFIAECVLVIVAAPVAALVATHVSLPDDIALRYAANGLLLPVAAAVALLLLLRGRRRWATVATAAGMNGSDEANSTEERPTASGQ